MKFTEPWNVAVDAAGNVTLADRDIGGHMSRLFRIVTGVGASILAQAKPPGAVYTAVAIEPTGNILVINIPNASPETELLRFHPTSGAFTTVAKGLKLVGSSSGVAIEANGAILVCDRKNGVVRVDPVTGVQSTVSTGGSFSRLPTGGGPIGLAVQR